DSTSKKCAARGAEGATCGDNGPFCRTDLHCVSGKCAGNGASGEACVFSLFGSSCGPGLYCDDSGSTPACAPRKKQGACSSFDACPAGLDSLGPAVDATGAVPKPGRCGPYLAVASSCVATLTESGCPGGTLCGATSHTCERVGIDGADCATTDCRDGLYCDGA